MMDKMEAAKKGIELWKAQVDKQFEDFYQFRKESEMRWYNKQDFITKLFYKLKYQS